MSTLSEQAEREGSADAVSPEPEITAQSGACARESVPLPSATALQAATQRVRAGLLLLTRMPEFLDRPGSLAHAHPPTFARARELHHERASRYNLWTPLRVTRLVYGYFHLIVIKPALNFAEWATETPLRITAAVILAFVLWHWS